MGFLKTVSAWVFANFSKVGATINAIQDIWGLEDTKTK